MKDIIILAKAFNKASKRNSKFCPFAYNIKEVVCGLVSFEKFIFSHDFAKAFWGEGIICKECGGEVMRSANTNWYCIHCDEYPLTIKYFLYCLQQMVLEKEPLKYLEKFL